MRDLTKGPGRRKRVCVFTSAQEVTEERTNHGSVDQRLLHGSTKQEKRVSSCCRCTGAEFRALAPEVESGLTHAALLHVASHESVEDVLVARLEGSEERVLLEVTGNAPVALTRRARRAGKKTRTGSAKVLWNR